jgi:hypothetical protein
VPVDRTRAARCAGFRSPQVDANASWAAIENVRARHRRALIACGRHGIAFVRECVTFSALEPFGGGFSSIEIEF